MPLLSRLAQGDQTQIKTEGRPMPGLKMKYFVLKPRGTDTYAKASRAAMQRYATFIEGENKELATELREWADTEGAEASPIQINADQ